MFSTKGRPRALTDAQVQRILQWQCDRKTVGQVARENGVSCGTIYTVIRNGGQYKRSLPLTNAERHRVLDWHRNRTSIVEVARRYGVSVSIIREVIRTGERCKSAPTPSMSRAEAKTRIGRRG